MLFLAQNGYRVIAHDRRGHGRSSQTSSGNDMNTYVDDLAAVIDHLDLKNAVLVGHSTGEGEVTRYVGRYGTKRVDKVVLIAAVPPLLLKTEANPEGLPIEVFDGLRSSLAKDLSQFYKDFAIMFYGANRAGAKVSQGMLDQFWLWSMQGSLKSVYECIKAFSETDFTEDLKKFDVPTLVLHGEDEWGWLAYWKEPSQSPAFLTDLWTRHEALFNPDGFPDLASVQLKWAEVEREQTEFVNRLTNESLEKMLPLLTTKISLAHLMQPREPFHLPSRSNRSDVAAA